MNEPEEPLSCLERINTDAATKEVQASIIPTLDTKTGEKHYNYALERFPLGLRIARHARHSY